MGDIAHTNKQDPSGEYNRTTRGVLLFYKRRDSLAATHHLVTTLYLNKMILNGIYHQISRILATRLLENIGTVLIDRTLRDK